MSFQGFKSTGKVAHVGPSDVAADLRAFLRDTEGQAQEVRPSDVMTWGASAGLEAYLRRQVDPEWKPKAYDVTGQYLTDAPLKNTEAREAFRRFVSILPDEFDEVRESVGELQREWVKGQADRLAACGTTWRGHVVRVFWRDHKGKERLRRQVGIHRCKAAWCPTCGRSRQAQIAGEVEKLLILAEDWGFHTGHARLLTLTSPNGPHIPTLREGTHDAFRKIQNTRWWSRHVFGFVRGSEVLTGEDGNWNFHIHLLVLFWHPRMDYAAIGRKWSESLGGLRAEGKHYVTNVQNLEAKAWERKDGKAGPLARRNLTRAARYISKYISKPEELGKLKGGPGGLGHLFTGTKGMRRASFGGGCAVLRRSAHVLMPRQLHQAEEAIAGTWLHEGKTPLRVEVMDPETGELVDLDPLPPDDQRNRALVAWGEALETNPEPKHGWKLPARVVGVPCGPKGRHRRLGAVPLASPQPTVRDWERRAPGGPSPLLGVRALVAGGDWKVYRWEHTTKAGKVCRYAAVLPGHRFAWRPIQGAVLRAVGLDAWTPTRQRANAAHAALALTDDTRTDVRRHLRAGVGQSLAQAKALRGRFESELSTLKWEAFTGRGTDAGRARIEALERAVSHLPARGQDAPGGFCVNLL